MKHLLNNLTEEEKNRIRVQHKDSIKVVTENFSRLINVKSGEIKPLISEEAEGGSTVFAIKGATDYLKGKKDGEGLDMYSKIYQYLEEKLKNFGVMHSTKFSRGNQPRPRWNLSWNCESPFYTNPIESKDWAAYIRPSFIDDSSGKVDGAELYLFIKKKTDIEGFVKDRLGEPVKKNIQFDFVSKKFDGLMYILKSQNDAQDAAYVISQIIAPKK